MATNYTSLEEIPRIHASLEKSFRNGKMQNVAFRKTQISRVAFMIKDNLEALQAALAKDLGRTKLETAFGDTNSVLHEAVEAWKNVEKWAKPIKASTTVTFRMMSPKVIPSPKGVVLIIGAFNYPIALALTPLISALAAGCVAVVKLPESLPTVSPLLAALISKYLDSSVVRVVQGAVDQVTALLNLEWNHIFFTGSTRVGKIVAAAAAKHVTPVTLELGGKNPVIVDPRRADYTLIARRILWGRTTNSGQVCICPEYVLIPREHQQKLASALSSVYKELYPNGAANSDSFGRLVNTASAKRVSETLKGTKGKILLGGESNGVFMEPTVLTDVTGEDEIMQDEVFAPLLSIVPVNTLDEAVAFINDRPQPLALYVFTQDSNFKDKITRNTRSGSIIFNDTMIQNVAPGLPFGGSGNSGYGQYHGKYGFDTFTHLRASADTPNWLEALVTWRYPPFSNQKYKLAMASTGPGTFPFDRSGKRTWSSRLLRFAPLLLLLSLIGYFRNRVNVRAYVVKYASD